MSTAAVPGPDDDTNPSVPGDRRTVAPAAAAWTTAWIVCGLSWRWSAPVAVSATLISAVLAVRTMRRRRRGSAASTSGRSVLIGATLCVAATAALAGMRLHALQTGPIADLAAAETYVRVEAVVTTDPQALRPIVRGVERVDDRSRVEVRVERLEARGRVWTLRIPVLALTDGHLWRRVAPGERLRFAGTVSGSAGQARFAAVIRPSTDPVQVDEPAWFMSAADSLRSGLRDSVDGFPAAPAGLVPALVVGDTSTLPPGLVDDMRTTGLTHLSAVSGANVAIVVGAVLLTTRALRLGSAASAFAAASTCLGFVLLARPEPSVLRAAVMGLLALLALGRGAGRRRSGRGSGVAALSATVLLLVLVDPFLSRSYGFALSVLATAALITLAPRWTRAWSSRMPQPLAAAIAVPLAAHLVTAPVVALLDPRLSLVAVPANLLVAPVVAPVTLLGVFATLAHPASPTVADALGAAATGCAWWIAVVAQRGADLSWASLPVPAGAAGAAMLALGALVALVALPRVCRLLVRHPQRRTVAFGAALLATPLVLVLPFRDAAAAWPPPDWVAVVCDVGQGDAVVLSTGRPGTAVVVDVGPEPAAVDRCLDRLDVRRVEVLVLSHFHADHTEGMPGLLDGREVGEVQVSPALDPPRQAERVQTWAEDSGLVVTTVGSGDEHHVGGLAWRVLWPARIIEDGSVANNASVVMLAQSQGIRLLLTGDIELAGQRALLARGDVEADVVKVPHHGSADFTGALVEAVDPTLAIVSAGLGNPYGHPTAAALDAWTAGGATTVRTDRSGDVAIISTPAGAAAVVRGR